MFILVKIKVVLQTVLDQEYRVYHIVSRIDRVMGLTWKKIRFSLQSLRCPFYECETFTETYICSLSFHPIQCFSSLYNYETKSSEDKWNVCFVSDENWNWFRLGRERERGCSSCPITLLLRSGTTIINESWFAYWFYTFLFRRRPLLPSRHLFTR